MAKYNLTKYRDSLVGTSEDDVFTVPGTLNSLLSDDTVAGGQGYDTLVFPFRSVGLSPDRLIGISSIERFDLTSAVDALGLVLDARTIGQADNRILTVAFGNNALALGVTSMNSGDAVVLAGTGQVTLRQFYNQKVKVADGYDGRIIGGIRNDTIIGGNGNDTLDGGASDDVVDGGSGNDILSGGDGVDLIISGSGIDTATGGRGADLFKVGSGTTTITDFDVGFHLERIDLRGISAATGFSALQVADTASGALVTVAGTSVVLNGVKGEQLSAGNFIFEGQTDTSIVLVSAGTSVDIIQRLIDEAPAGTTIRLEAGVFEFDKTLKIGRSDISLEGAGSDKTVIRSTISDAEAAPTIQVQAALADNKFADIAATAVKGSKTITLSTAAGVKVGDILYISQDNDTAFLAETGNTGITLPNPSNPSDSPLRESLSKVVAVSGNTVTLAEALPYTFQAGKAWAGKPALLKNLEVGGFRIETPFAASDPLSFENTRPDWSGIATLSFRGITDSKIYDIGTTNTGSTAFAFTRAYGIVADHLTAVGAQNKGGDGNGYAWALSETFASTFTHLTDKDMRHSVLFSSWNAEHYNNIQVDFTNRDINFHGSPDSGNTVLVTRSVASYDPDQFIWPTVGPGSFPVHPYSTIEDNDVRFVYLRSTVRNELVHAAQSGGDIDAGGGHDQVYGGRSADRLAGGEGNDSIWGSGGNDQLFGGDGADVLRGGADNDTLWGDGGADILDGEAGTDTLLGGAGNDFLRLGAGDTGSGGSGSDTFSISGNAAITDFAVADPLEKIDLRGVTGATGFAALKLTQIEADTRVVVGSVTLTLKNVKASDLRAENFLYLGDRTPTIAQLHSQLPNVVLLDGSYVGTAGNDLIEMTAAQFGDGANDSAPAQTTIVGGGGSDRLRLASDTVSVLAGAFNKVSSVEILDVSLATTTAVVEVGAAAVAQADGDRLTIYGGAQNIVLNASAVGSAGRVLVETTGTVSLRRDVDNVVTVSDSLSGKVIGDTGRDAITGGARADTLSGGAGDDVLVGGGGNDTLDGGSEDDSLDGGLGRDTLLGGEGDDKLALGTDDTGSGGVGSDVFVITGNATITDFTAADRMEKIDLRAIQAATGLSALTLTQVGADARIVVGGVTVVLKNVAVPQITEDAFIFYGETEQTLADLHALAPRALMTSGVDRLTGTSGNDIFEGTGPSFTVDDTIQGGAGTDTLRFVSGNVGILAAGLSRLSSIEVIDVSKTAGTVYVQADAAGVGQADGDRLTILGGMKDIVLDTVAVGSAGTVVVETFGTVSLRPVGQNAVTVSDAVEGRVVGNVGRDAITGGARADTLSGGDNDDLLGGGGGDDRIDGGAGDDILSGGTGRDTLFGDVGNDILRLEGDDIATGGAGSDTFAILGNATITDFAVADRMEKIDLRGLAAAKSFSALKITQVGADTTVAVDGATVVLKDIAAAAIDADDFIFAGQTARTLAELHSHSPVGTLTSGADRLVGTAGNDVFEGSAGSFTAADTISGGAGADTLSITSGTFARGEDALARLSSVEIIDVSKTAGTAAFQIGAAGVGQADDDRLTLLGGTIDMVVDTGSVGKAGTVVVETFGTVILRQGVHNAVTVSDAVEGKVVGANGNDTIIGGARADTLSGGIGNDLLFGNGGADRLAGEAGSDVLTGGDGADTFVFATALGSGNIDRITDFVAGDTIQLANSVFAALTSGPLAAGAFKDLGVAGATLDADDRIVYDQGTGVLAYDADGSGKATAVTFAMLDNKALLTHADLLVA